MNKKIIRFKKFTLTATLATYLLIFIGGLVRVSGAGLGCPDWPKCFGRWIPPTDISQVPPGFDASQFNIVLAWVEYFNRLFGIWVGIAILFMVFLGLKNFRHIKQIKIPVIAVVVLLLFQGWHGSVVVSSLLEPFIVSVHLIFALSIAALLIYITQSVYYIRGDVIENRDNEQLKIFRRLFIGIFLFSILQILLGTEVRSKIDALVKQYPNISPHEIIPLSGMINHIHMISGIILTVFAVSVIMVIFKKNIKLPKASLRGIQLIPFLLLLQMILGFLMQIFGSKPVLQLFHLWTAAILFGFLFMIQRDMKRGEIRQT